MNRADALETINAAATVIASSENRDPHASIQVRKKMSFGFLIAAVDYVLRIFD